MHRALDIEDILVPICEYLETGRDLLSFACASKCFCFVALTKLWRSCNRRGLYQLETLLECQTFFPLTPEKLDVDIERLSMRARSIQHLDLLDEDGSWDEGLNGPGHLDETLVSLANGLNMHPLLPSLRSLKVRVDVLQRDSVLLLLSHLLPSVIRLTILLEVPRLYASSWNDHLTSTLKLIPARVPNLQHVNISEYDPDSERFSLIRPTSLQRAPILLIQPLDELNSFEYKGRGINLNLLSVLGRKHTLTTLILSDTRSSLSDGDVQHDGSDLQSIQGVLFESLREIQLKMDHALWASVLRLVSAPNLAVITAFCPTSQQEGNACLAAFAQKVSSFACLVEVKADWTDPMDPLFGYHSLRRPQLQGTQIGDDSDPDYGLEHTNPVRWAHFAPLLTCRQLTSLCVDLRAFRPLRVIDEDIEAMASTCIGLESLILRSSIGKVVRGQSPTLSSLVSIATHCPRMRHLELGQVDGRVGCLRIPGTFVDARPTLELSMILCPIDEPRNVAELLVALWPDIVILKTDTMPVCSTRTWADWALVNKHMDDMKREQEEKHPGRLDVMSVKVVE